jgi:lipopolysaccharide transport system ATP-binding protein
MAYLKLQNVSVDFPIYNANARSLKKRLIQVATGGQLGADEQGRVMARALDGLSLTLKDGDRVGLLGHNGAGKSTLLRLLIGVYQPSSGSLETKGEIGSLIDISLGIDPEATGRENIYIRGALLGMKKTYINSQIENIIEFSELGDFIDMPLRTYSTGMQLRLAFAVSTLTKPEILLMDEWLSVGDERFKEKAEERLKEMVKATNILVIATHSRELLLQSCNRAIWLEHGKIRMDNTPEIVAQAYFKEAASGELVKHG